MDTAIVWRENHTPPVRMKKNGNMDEKIAFIQMKEVVCAKSG